MFTISQIFHVQVVDLTRPVFYRTKTHPVTFCVIYRSGRMFTGFFTLRGMWADMGQVWMVSASFSLGLEYVTRWLPSCVVRPGAMFVNYINIPSSVLQQVHSLFQNVFATKRDIGLPLLISSIRSFHNGHPEAPYLFFLVLPSLLSFLLSFLQ